MFPFMQVGQVDLAVAVDVFALFDLHSAGGAYKHHRRVVGVSLHQP